MNRCARLTVQAAVAISRGFRLPLALRWHYVGTTLIIDHAENGLVFDSATAVNLVVPTDANVPFPVGTSVLIEQAGAGAVNFVGQSAGGDTVQIDVRVAFLKTTAGQYAPATLVKKAANRWLLSGDLVFA